MHADLRGLGDEAGGAIAQIGFAGTFVDESTATAGSGDIGAMDGAVAIGAAVRQRQTCSVMVSSMALQTEGRFVEDQQSGVGRAVDDVTEQAVFGDGRVLIGIRSAILGMAIQTQGIDVGASDFEIAAIGTTVGIVTVDAAHLSFAEGMVVRHAHLGDLGRVAFEAGFVGLPHGANDVIGFR